MLQQLHNERGGKVKCSELKKELSAGGCYFFRGGSDHEIWYSPITNKKFTVPRHDSKEVPSGTVRNIKKLAGIE